MKKSMKKNLSTLVEDMYDTISDLQGSYTIRTSTTRIVHQTQQH